MRKLALGFSRSTSRVSIMCLTLFELIFALRWHSWELVHGCFCTVGPLMNRILVTRMPCLYYISSCCVKKQVSLIILRMDQFASLANPYYCSCLFIYFFVSCKPDSAKRCGWAGLMWEEMAVFLDGGFCYKNLSQSQSYHKSRAK